MWYGKLLYDWFVLFEKIGKMWSNSGVFCKWLNVYLIVI